MYVFMYNICMYVGYVFIQKTWPYPSYILSRELIAGNAGIFKGTLY